MCICAILMVVKCYLIVFLICIFLTIRDAEHLFCFYWLSAFFFGEMSIQVLWLCFNWVVWVLGCCWVVGVLYIFWILFPCQMCKFFLLFHKLPNIFIFIHVSDPLKQYVQFFVMELQELRTLSQTDFLYINIILTI